MNPSHVSLVYVWLAYLNNITKSIVSERGLEPPRRKAQVPKTCVYTNFTTPTSTRGSIQKKAPSCEGTCKNSNAFHRKRCKPRNVISTIANDYGIVKFWSIYPLLRARTKNEGPKLNFANGICNIPSKSIRALIGNKRLRNEDLMFETDLTSIISKFCSFSFSSI